MSLINVKKKKNRNNNDSDEEYKPSLKEIKEIEKKDEDKSKHLNKKRRRNNDNEENKLSIKNNQERKKEKTLKNLKKKNRKNNDNDEYKPSLIEIQEAEKEYESTLIEIKEVEKEIQNINNENENENNEGKVDILIRPLNIKVVGRITYELAETGHVLAVIHKGNNSVVIETIKDDKTSHNIATITQLKDFNFPKKYFKFLTVPIPDDISINDIINNVTIDKGKYEVGKNDCFDTIKEILIAIHADKKAMKKLEIDRPKAIKTLCITGINIPFYPFKKLVELLRGIEKKNKKK